jgi:hypothetical protein
LTSATGPGTHQPAQPETTEDHEVEFWRSIEGSRDAAE